MFQVGQRVIFGRSNGEKSKYIRITVATAHKAYLR